MINWQILTVTWRFPIAVLVDREGSLQHVVKSCVKVSCFRLGLWDVLRRSNLSQVHATLSDPCKSAQQVRHTMRRILWSSSVSDEVKSMEGICSPREPTWRIGFAMISCWIWPDDIGSLGLWPSALSACYVASFWKALFVYMYHSKKGKLNFGNA